MYTENELQDDLYDVCKTYFIKMQVLNSYINKQIDEESFVNLLKHKDEETIKAILSKLDLIIIKNKNNGGVIDKNPIALANELKKNNNLNEAYRVIIEYIKHRPTNAEAHAAFDWIMYDFLKKNEGNIENYIKSLNTFNKYSKLNFKYDDEDEKKLIRSFLWSIVRVVNSSDFNANRLCESLLEFCGGTAFIDNKAEKSNNSFNSIFINTIISAEETDNSVARVLIKKIIDKLDINNYFRFIDSIGFDWLNKYDCEEKKSVTSEGKEITKISLEEKLVNSYAKKLTDLSEINNENENRINCFMVILDKCIIEKPNYQWLPYYKGQLLNSIHRKSEAYAVLTKFALSKKKETYIWDKISDCVEKEEKFKFLCAGLLCKGVPKMVVGLQKKIIPHLIERKMYENAKFELDKLIKTNIANEWKITQQLLSWQKEDWYINTDKVEDRTTLIAYAKEAENALYDTLPIKNIYVSYVNKEKNTVHFNYISGKSQNEYKQAYTIIDTAPEEIVWQTDVTYKVKMDKVSSFNEELFQIYRFVSIDSSDDNEFIKSSSGYVEKNDVKQFAFVDDVFISPSIVEQHSLEDSDKIDFVKKFSFNKKRNAWGWSVHRIKSVSKV